MYIFSWVSICVPIKIVPKRMEVQGEQEHTMRIGALTVEKHTRCTRGAQSRTHAKTKTNLFKIIIFTERHSRLKQLTAAHIFAWNEHIQTHTHTDGGGSEQPREAARSSHTNHLKHTAAHLQHGTICADNKLQQPNTKYQAGELWGTRTACCLPLDPN